MPKCWRLRLWRRQPFVANSALSGRSPTALLPLALWPCELQSPAVKTANPALNVVLFILLPVPLDNGGLSAEAEVFDASTGDRVGAILWAGQGLWNPTGYFSAYGHPRQLTDSLAKAVAGVLKKDTARLLTP